MKPAGGDECRWRPGTIAAGSADANAGGGDAHRVNIETIDALEWIDLADREHDGISVTLYWARSTKILAVTVADACSGDYFELVLANDEPPLEVFYHPYAYARRRGVVLLTDRQGDEVGVDS